MTMLATKPNVLPKGRPPAGAVAGRGKVSPHSGLGGLLDLLWRAADLLDEVAATIARVEAAVRDLEGPGCPMNLGLAQLGVLRRKQLRLAEDLATNSSAIRAFLAAAPPA